MKKPAARKTQGPKPKTQGSRLKAQEDPRNQAQEPRLKTQDSRPASPAPPTRITSLGQLERIVERPVEFVDWIWNERVLITGRLLHPEETEQLRLILNEALPPLVEKDVNGQKVREHDNSDPKFLEKLRRGERLARALACYWAFPLFAAERPGLADREEILKFVESRKLTERLLDRMQYVATAREDEAGVEQRVDF